MEQTKRPLSASQLSTWLMCGRRYAFRYVHRVEPEHRPAALGFGRAVHSALELFHLRKLEGETVPKDVLVRTFRADWQAEVDGGLSFKDDESAALLREQGETLIAQYAAWFPDRKVVAAEMPFEMDLVDPESGEVSGERLRGFFDFVLDRDVVGEVKTSARRYDEGTLARKLQFSAYAYAWRMRTGRDPTVMVVSLLKQKKPSVDDAIAPRTKADDAFFFHLALEVARAIESRSFPPNPGWSCGDCEYATACRSWRGSPAPHARPIAGFVPLSAVVSRVVADARAIAER